MKLRTISPEPTSRTKASATSSTTIAVPQPVTGREVRRPAGAPQEIHHVGTRRAERGHEAEDHGRHQRGRGGKGNHRRVDDHAVHAAAGCRGRARRADRFRTWRGGHQLTRQGRRAAGSRRATVESAAGGCRRAPRAPPARARAPPPRTSSRFATFAHAISITKQTAPISVRITGCTSATRSWCIGSTRRWKPAVCLIANRRADRRRSRRPLPAPARSSPHRAAGR